MKLSSAILHDHFSRFFVCKITNNIININGTSLFRLHSKSCKSTQSFLAHSRATVGFILFKEINDRSAPVIDTGSVQNKRRAMHTFGNSNYSFMAFILFKSSNGGKLEGPKLTL